MWKCAWPPDAIQRMMELQDAQSHNEIVLDSQFWVDRLPHTIEAFFAVRWPDDLLGPPHYLQRPEKQRIGELHSSFLREYGLDNDDVPLLLFDGARSPPFSTFARGV